MGDQPDQDPSAEGSDELQPTAEEIEHIKTLRDRRISPKDVMARAARDVQRERAANNPAPAAEAEPAPDEIPDVKTVDRIIDRKMKAVEQAKVQENRRVAYRRDLRNAVVSAVKDTGFDTPEDIAGIETVAIAKLHDSGAAARMGPDELLAAVAKEAKKEIERRGGKSAAADQKTEAEARMTRQRQAGESAGGRSSAGGSETKIGGSSNFPQKLVFGPNAMEWPDESAMIAESQREADKFLANAHKGGR